MKTSLLFITYCLLSGQIWAQQDSLISSADDITDILSQKKLQNSENGKALSILEDKINQNSCLEVDDIQKCEHFAESLMPKSYLEKGWRSLLEIKYQPIEKKSSRIGTSNGFVLWDPEIYYASSGRPKKELKTEADMNAEVDQFYNWAVQNANPGYVPIKTEIRYDLIFNQLQTSEYYEQLPDIKAKNNYMYDRLGEYTKSMSDEEYLKFMSAAAMYASTFSYDESRALFSQDKDHGKGIVTPFELMSGERGGICGDIHTMAAVLAEKRNWEVFTVGFALDGAQHVVTAAVNPNEPNKLMVVNYGTYEEQDLKDGDWVNPTPMASSSDEIGIQMRIFKNKKSGDPSGSMQQIATIPTNLGSFMNDLFKKEYQLNKAMPQNQNFRSEKVGAQNTFKHDVKTNAQGTKVTESSMGTGLIVYEGQTDRANIYGIAVSLDTYKNIYRWDPKQNKCVLKKNKYFSAGVANNLLNLTQAEFENTYFAYLNIKGGTIFHVYQSEHFQFKGLLGYELEGFGSRYDKRFLSADGELTSLMGIMADYEKNGITIHTGMNLQANLGLREQRLMPDLESYFTNAKIFNPNAISFDANLTKSLFPKTKFVTNNNVTMTRVGGRVFLSTGILHKNTSIMASYQGGVKPVNIGNTLQQVNLLQNFNNLDGLRLTVGQNFSNKKRTISGSLSGYGGISTSTIKPQPMAGASLKINVNGKKKPTKKSTDP